MGNKIQGLYTWAKSPADYLNQRYKVENGCWIWTSLIDKDGYGQVQASKYGRLMKCSRAHQLSYKVFKGEYKKGLLICHTCHNPTCINPEHLYAGTPADNSRDMREAGRANPIYGENHPYSKITSKDVLFIQNAKGKYTCFELGEKYNMSFSQICKIWRKERRLRG